MKKWSFLKIALVFAAFCLLVPIGQLRAASNSELRDFLTTTLELPAASTVDLSESISRGEAVEWIGRYLRISVDTADAPLYRDIRKTKSYAPYISQLYKIGALPRVSRYRMHFYPSRSIKLYDVLHILFYAEGIPVPRIIDSDIGARDISQTAHFAPIFKKAIDLKVLVPDARGFVRPFHLVTRAEIAQILYNMWLQSDNSLPSRPSDDVSQPIDTPIVSVPNYDGSYTDSAELEYFKDVLSTVYAKYLHSNALSDRDRQRMMYGALEGMIQEMGDPHSIFFRPQDSDNFQDSLGGQFEGIGAYIGQNPDGRIIITSPIKGSPAAKAGLLSNDIITRVDAISVIGKTLPAVIRMIKGPKGSKVILTIERKDKTTKKVETLNIVVIRNTININSVETELLYFNGKKISHIMVHQFGGKTSSEFNRAVEKILFEDKPQGIILDMRGNPGGYLDTAVSMLGYFLKKGDIAVQIKYPSYSLKREVVFAQDAFANYPLVVLIDGASASASEIVAGALQELKKTPLIGEKSYGKGTVQELMVYDDGATLKLTVAEYTLPSGRSIDGIGLQPDVMVTDDLETKDVDEALQRALKEVSSYIKS